MSQLIVIGEVRAVHGLKGHFKITSYTETPDDVFRYGPCRLGKKYSNITLKKLKELKTGFIASCEQIKTRELANSLVLICSQLAIKPVFNSFNFLRVIFEYFFPSLQGPYLNTSSGVSVYDVILK